MTVFWEYKNLRVISKYLPRFYNFTIGIILTYPNRKRECLFYLASANYKVGEYRKALTRINELLISEPNNPQALELKDKIEKKLTNGIFNS